MYDMAWVHYILNARSCGKGDFYRSHFMKAQVILYMRPGCHLCAEAKREMLAAGCANDYDFSEVNIDADPILAARYGWDIPVITINGVVAFKHRLSASAFRHELQLLKEKSP
jgi:glutaredoxin